MKTQKQPIESGVSKGHLHLAQVLDEVVGKRIVIIYNQNHSTPEKLPEPRRIEKESFANRLSR